MWCNRFGLRIFTLCLTFRLGLLAADQFSAARVQPPEETKPEEIKRVIVAHDPKEMNYDSVKPQCKKFYEDFEGEFTDEQLKPVEKQSEVRISRKGKAEHQEPKAPKSEKSLEELQKEIDEILKNARRESKTAHNLLYIENCAEYY